MSNRAPESDLWDAVRGALVTRALGIVSELGIAHKLADCPRPVVELAKESGADPDTLHRLLRALASDGIFAEEAPGVFRNTDVSEQLLRPGWAAFAHFFGGVWHQSADTRLILFEAVVPEGNEPGGGKWLDLLMLALFAGRERNEAQWRQLLEENGFEPTSIEHELIQARCR